MQAVGSLGPFLTCWPTSGAGELEEGREESLAITVAGVMNGGVVAGWEFKGCVLTLCRAVAVPGPLVGQPWPEHSCPPLEGI